MRVNFNLCGAEDVREDLEKLNEFKNRWFNLISGWSEINDDEKDLERSKAILGAILVYENMLSSLKYAENKNSALTYTNADFNFCETKDIREDLEKLVEFKERWFELISDWRQINDDEKDLERSKVVLSAIMNLKNLLYALEQKN